MREIKFRGIADETTNEECDIKEGTMLFGSLAYADGTPYILGNMVEVDSEMTIFEFWIPIKPETVGQYTGLKDKNGKEIYEGDVVQDDDEFALIVKFGLQEVDAFEGMGFNVWTFMDGAHADGKRLSRSYEVVGNIYENPELLESK